MRYKYLDIITTAFAVVLILSNIASSKIVGFSIINFDGGTILFPLAYIFGDILTEVYGYKASRKIIWSGFAALVFMSFCYWLIQTIPAPVFWQNQKAYELILGAVPRIVLGSIIAYFLGEFSNSYVLSRMKIWSNGRHLWMRTIGSTIIGEGVDSLIFGVIAFAGTIPFFGLLVLILSGYLAKVAYEIIATPITYLIVNKLKQAESIDVYDRGISYNPFILKE